MLAGVPDHPPLSVILTGPHSKISAMGPKLRRHCVTDFMVSDPSTVYHLIFTPYPPFLAVTQLKNNFLHMEVEGSQ